MKSIFVYCSLFIITTLSSPVPSKRDNQPYGGVLYDQRQEGEWNIRADLKNFVILIIPTQEISSSTPRPTLLDFLSKTLPKKKNKYSLQRNKNKDVIDEQTQHFIEAKTAPYHVDISSMRDHLEKLHPEPIVVNAEDVVVAKSPAVALIKRDDNQLSVVDGNKSEIVDKTAIVVDEELKLLGAENEQCGPGLARDSTGVCQIIQK